MRSISLFSKKPSILKHWEKHIDKKYTIVQYKSLSELYKDLDKTQIDIILFDYSDDTLPAEELLEYTKSEEINTRIMMLNSRPLFSEGAHLLRHGARAFMNAYSTSENLNQAIGMVLEDNIWLYPEFIQAMIKQNLFSHVEKSNVLKQLSTRQHEIAEMIALGMSNKEIATQADITEQTVKTHLKDIYEKLNVSSRLELAIMINKMGNT